jgi:hypothetical protein
MPLEQKSNALNFYAFFTYNKQGLTSAAPVLCDVWRIGVGDAGSYYEPTVEQIFYSFPCVAVGGGVYKFTLAPYYVTIEGEYICLFKTTNALADQQWIPSIWVVSKAGTEYLDAAVTSRTTTQQVWDWPTNSISVAGSTGERVKNYLNYSVTALNASLDDMRSAYTNARAALLDRLDVVLSTRLSKTDFDAVGIPAMKTKVDLYLDAKVSTRTTSGVGAYAFTTTINRPDNGAPIEGVAVWVTTDSAGAIVVAGTSNTNAGGQVTFYLDLLTTYYMWCQKSGFDFSNPKTFTVTV